ncbi:hypothetical protein ACIBK9_10660 [Nonomuraea sp. NPDC050227]|uniref:hypothetical protein n=1 Tax=Nonomuraea sp. NPDC050227 TaxID=3364360 RepID=UPI0037B4DDA8
MSTEESAGVRHGWVDDVPVAWIEPPWRCGSRTCALDDPGRLLPQGHAGGHAQWWFDRLNPLTNIGAHAHGPAIAFECGADDSRDPELTRRCLAWLAQPDGQP